MDQLSFSRLWAVYQHNRPVAAQLVKSEVNRCAIVMSLTLRKRPRAGEKSLLDILDGVQENYRKDARLRTVYIRSHELALRLQSDWGKPLVFRTHPRKALAAISGQDGVVYFDHAYAHGVGHIDLFNGTMIGCKFWPDGSDDLTGPNDPFALAKGIWFWSTNKVVLG